MARRPSVYGIGFLALDVVRSALRKTSVNAYAGGTCGNVLAVLAYLGWGAYPIARLNGDPASERVKTDLRNVGVMLELAECAPTVSTPVVLQIIRRSANGISPHRFEWACPECGNALPRFKPVPARAVPKIAARMIDPSVFFIDRISRSSLELAKIARERGALVYLEPSEIADPRLFGEALRVAHVVKYSNDRLRSLGHDARMSGILLEIQTLGSQGLVYRSRLARNPAWVHLPAVPAPILRDACGAGDWCSAGVIARLGSAGLDGLYGAEQGDVADALRYGQTLAAWNCRFEGARGGMYRVKRSIFVRQVRAMLGGVTALRVRVSGESGTVRTSLVPGVACPACPSRPPRALTNA
ncbi:MAG: carbohydrate kinase [Betaproteobacteria bacterium]|nr:carbohydrate kinase [Betaproteobacteria bacterium]